MSFNPIVAAAQMDQSPQPAVYGYVDHAQYPVLDGMRAFSILFVLTAHLLPLDPFLNGLNNAFGLMGMSLFFSLSGFLITSSLYRNTDVVSFLIKRIFRILPAFLMVISVVYLAGIGLTAKGYILNIFFISNYFYEGLGPGTGHLWSICVEMQFYLAIALIVMALGRRGLWLIPVFAIAVTGLRIYEGVYANINTHLRVDEILFGGCLALYTIHRSNSKEIRALVKHRAIASVLLIGVCGLWLASSHSLSGALNYFRPILASTLVGLLLLGPYHFIQSRLSSKPLRYIASISYALYLYHPLMASGWLATGTSTERYLIKRPITFVLTWVAAHLSTYYWEAPWNKYARKNLIERWQNNNN